MTTQSTLQIVRPASQESYPRISEGFGNVRGHAHNTCVVALRRAKLIPFRKSRSRRLGSGRPTFIVESQIDDASASQAASYEGAPVRRGSSSRCLLICARRRRWSEAIKREWAPRAGAIL